MGDDSEAIVNFRKEMNDSRVTAVKTDNLDSFNLFGEAEPGIKIDFVFYDGFGSCLEFRTIQEQYAGKPYISDHYPVVCKFSVL